MKVLLCPGQGAQYPGMGRDIAERWPEAKALFDRADEALGTDLSRTMFEGSAEDVERTDVWNFWQSLLVVNGYACVPIGGEESNLIFVESIEASTPAPLQKAPSESTHRRMGEVEALRKGHPKRCPSV